MRQERCLASVTLNSDLDAAVSEAEELGVTPESEENIFIA